MASEAHLSELSEKHRRLDEQIAQEEQRPYADEARIKSLKRKKLHLKDQIEVMSSSSMSKH